MSSEAIGSGHLQARLPGLSPDDLDAFRVEVVRSKRRTKSYGARLQGGVLRVTVPSWMSVAEESVAVAEMSARFRRKMSTARIDLAQRTRALHRKYAMPAPRDVRWSDTMASRWASCTPSTATIRVSTRIAAFPDWVIDYVLVHEMAHLRHGDHSAAFWNAVSVYPKAERAIGYLIAKSGDDGGGLD
ncbi:MAG: M48 family metallopeptidase [Ilumatobacteraceae bacterium]